MRIKLKYTNSFADKTGKLRTYLRLPGKPALALPGLPGSSAFMLAYSNAMAASAATEPRDAAGSVASVIASYLASPGFLKLAEASQVNYRFDLGKLNEQHGDKLVADLQPRHVRQQLAALAGTPSAAISRLRALRLTVKHAISLGIVENDVTSAIKAPALEGDGYVAWPAEAIAAYQQRHAPGTMAHLALMLGLFTGQRRSDLIRLSHADIVDGSIRLVQAKTKVALVIPIHPELQSAIDAMQVTGIGTLLVAPDGKPFTPGGFSDWFRRRVAEAGLADLNLSVHGLRKSCAAMLATAGATPHMISSIIGHKDLAMVAHYSRSADQAKLAKDAMAKLG